MQKLFPTKTSKLFLFLAFFTAGVVTISIEAHAKEKKKVAVILNMGSGGGQGAFIRLNTNLAKEVYEAQGYEVIVLSNEFDNDPKKWATKTNLENALKGRKDISDLKIDLYGHGNLMNSDKIPANMKNRFPDIPISNNGGIAGDQITDYSKPNVFLAQSVTPEIAKLKEASNTDPEAKKKFTELLLKEGLGVGDFRNIIGGLQKKNPDMKSELLTLNCFSGSIGQGLTDLKNTTVFTAAESARMATTFNMPAEKKDNDDKGGPPAQMSMDEMQKSSLTNTAEYPRLVNQQIKKALDAGKPITLNEAHKYAFDIMKRNLLSTNSNFNFPTSGAQNFLYGWCGKNVSRDGVCLVDKNDGSADAESGVSHFLSEEILKVNSPSQEIINWCSNYLSQNKCNDPKLVNSIKYDQESRLSLRKDLIKTAFEKIEEKLKDLSGVDLVALSNKNKENLKNEIKMAKASVFCDDGTDTCADAQKWKYEQKYIDDMEEQLKIFKPTTAEDLQKAGLAKIKNYKEDGCFYGTAACVDAFGKDMGLQHFLDFSADLFEPDPNKSNDPMDMGKLLCQKDEAMGPMGDQTPPGMSGDPDTKADLDKNKETLACIREHSNNHDGIIRLAKECGDFRSFKPLHENCQKIQKQHTFYQEHLACGQHFIESASPAEKERFLSVLAAGEKPITKAEQKKGKK